MFGLGAFELMVIGIFAILLFGSKLPEVARSLGGSYREFKRSLNDLQDQFRMADTLPPPKPTPRNEEDDPDLYTDTAAPKFTPPPARKSDDADRT